MVGVADASIAIEEGEICVLMGLSGSGKSTLLRCVNGLNKATRGEVLVDDASGPVDVTRCDPATLRRLRTRRIAMVFQQFALLPWRTVAENVGFGLELRGMAKPERDQVVAEKLKLVGLEQWQDKYAHELSGGMQQRVGLARAFATDADILLMDEPFSALDPLIRTRLQDELLELQRTLRKTIIFVSHDLDEAMKLGSHISIMEAGRIVQYGEPEDIVLNPANDYVADFVAHMNPLNVLTGTSLMTPVTSIARCGDRILLDRNQRVVMALGADGAPRAVTIVDRPGRIVSYARRLRSVGARARRRGHRAARHQAAHRARDPPPHRQPARAGRGRQADRGDRRRRDLPRHPAPDRHRGVASGSDRRPRRQGERDEQGRSDPGVRALCAGVPG